jgi:hypothetical protein
MSGLFGTWQGWVYVVLIVLPVLAIQVLVWELAGVFGWGIFGKLAAEVFVHGLLFSRLHPIMNRRLNILARPYLQEELFEFVREELPLCANQPNQYAGLQGASSHRSVRDRSVR